MKYKSNYPYLICTNIIMVSLMFDPKVSFCNQFQCWRADRTHQDILMQIRPHKVYIILNIKYSYISIHTYIILMYIIALIKCLERALLCSSGPSKYPLFPSILHPPILDEEEIQIKSRTKTHYNQEKRGRKNIVHKYHKSVEKLYKLYGYYGYCLSAAGV